MFIISFLQKLFYPWKCLGCGEFDVVLCPRCRRELEFLEVRGWASMRGENRLNIHSFFEYQEPSGLVRRLVKLLKYQSMESIIKCLEGILLPSKRLFRNDYGFDGKLYYVPVPLHWRRQCERGFNQATLLARIFKKIWQGEIVEDLFVRNQYTIAQASLDRAGRLDNLRGKFTLQTKVLEKLDKNARFILVDDVITTGSTMWVLVEELKKAGVNNFLALSLARD